MQLPIRNYLSKPLTVFIEILCGWYEVPVGGEAVVILEDGHPHSMDIHSDNRVSIWNEGSKTAIVEIFDEYQFPKRKRGVEQHRIGRVSHLFARCRCPSYCRWRVNIDGRT